MKKISFSPAFAWIPLMLLTQASASAAPCDPGTSFSNPFQGKRVQAACEFKDAMLKGYAMIYQKEKRIRNIDGSRFRSGRHLDACIAQEVEILDSETPTSYIEWMDRVRECGAAFQDTHLDLQPAKSQPWISLGFSLIEIQGHYFIKSVAPRVLLSGLPREQAMEFQAGAEITAIHGQPIESLVQELLPMVPGSSNLYRKQEALNLVTERAFHYPLNPQTSVTFTDGATYTFDWSADLTDTQDLLTLKALQDRGYQHTPSLPWLDESKLPDELLEVPSFAGYSDRDAAVPNTAFDRMEGFHGATEKDPALRFVQVDAKKDGVEHSYCYLQLASFAEDQVRGARGSKQDYSKPMRRFLRQCKRAGLPLVLDIRTNPGGYLDLGAETLAAITPRKQRAATRSAWAYREDEVYRELDGAYFDGEYWGGNTVELDPRERFDRKVGGYQGKVLALVTPYCISSCDRLAAFLKTSGRATLIGTPTNGTGAGFQNWTDATTGRLHSDWLDSTGVLTAQIPDQLFGAIQAAAVPLHSGKPSGFFPWLKWLAAGRPEATEYQPMDFYEASSLLENHPTEPDLSYAPSPNDLVRGQEGWIDIIQKNL